MALFVDTSELETAPAIIQQRIEKNIRDAFGAALAPTAAPMAKAKLVSRRQWVDVDAYTRQRFREMERVKAYRRRVAKRRGFYFQRGKKGTKRGVRLRLRTPSGAATGGTIVQAFFHNFTETWGD